MKIIKGLRQVVFAVPAMLLLMSADALAVTLKDIKFSTMAGDITEIALEFDGAPPEVSGYTIEKPARIAIDLPGVQSALQTKRHEIGNGNARSATIVATKDRARLVVNLTQLAAYTTTANGNTLLVRIGERSEEKVFAGNTVTSASGASVSPASDMKVVNVDFRRGELGEGQIQIMLNDARASANIRREGSKIIADLSGNLLNQN